MKLRLITLLSTLLISTGSFASDYKALICDNCNYSSAKSLAKIKLEPDYQCYNDFNGPEGTHCYSASNSVAIIDNTTGETFGFRVGHTGQGGEHAYFTLTIKDITLPQEIKALAAKVLKTYKTIDALSNTLSKDIPTPSSQDQITSAVPCSKSNVSKTVEQAFNANTLSAVTIKAQDFYIQHGDAFFERSVFTAANFSVGVGDFGLGGTWNYVPENRVIIHSYPGTKKNQVSYEVKIKNNILHLESSRHMTYFDNISLNIILSSKNSLNTLKLSSCIIKLLNKKFLARVYSTPDDIENSKAVAVGYNIEFKDSGTVGGGPSGEGCIWHLYDGNGNEIASFVGGCP
ncbi:hypothetical protein [Pseudoalteromonas denitrificans]|uniref:Uncharacterized protein n=1 Tax=Pseudoalteromonas denitrificans DSM 6059 TaxID=1123010 RepID=A0A1I1J2X6_9GAMM|nr:hypothetical protein [Pseudoalteromonas denitrificans]SFC42907.1 hypothetical protein SAMN02745724_01636 [Pseudoalteromonas denitrificans DSM 6059]